MQAAGFKLTQTGKQVHLKSPLSSARIEQWAQRLEKHALVAVVEPDGNETS